MISWRNNCLESLPYSLPSLLQSYSSLRETSLGRDELTDFAPFLFFCTLQQTSKVRDELCDVDEDTEYESVSRHPRNPIRHQRSHTVDSFRGQELAGPVADLALRSFGVVPVHTSLEAMTTPVRARPPPSPVHHSRRVSLLRRSSSLKRSVENFWHERVRSEGGRTQLLGSNGNDLGLRGVEGGPV